MSLWSWSREPGGCSGYAVKTTRPPSPGRWLCGLERCPLSQKVAGGTRGCFPPTLLFLSLSLPLSSQPINVSMGEDRNE